MSLKKSPIQKIVSGGQTGVDRAALDVAIFLEMEHGGWCPAGRRAEDGAIPERYDLKEMSSRDYAKRTEQNVVDSDGTLVLYWAKMKGGTRLTYRLAAKHQRPRLSVDLFDKEWPTEFVRDWIATENISVLNVGGPRESSHQGIGKLAEQFLSSVFGTSESCNS